MNKYDNLKPLLYFLFVLLTSCATTNTDLSDDQLYTVNVKFNIVAQGQYSNISLPRQLVITNQSDWQRLWQIHGGNQKQQLPQINFDDNMVIAIFAGQQPSGGYVVGINGLKRLDENLTVLVTFREPQPGEQVSLALTQPYIFISTAKVDGNVRFVAGASLKSDR